MVKIVEESPTGPLTKVSNAHPGCFMKSISTTSCSSRKNVSFDRIEILQFPIELGDNPAVHEGPPIQLGWTLQQIDVLEVDIYEVFRNRRRDRHALALSMDKRVESLLSHGYTKDEILAAMVECARIRHQRHLSACWSIEKPSILEMDIVS